MTIVGILVSVACPWHGLLPGFAAAAVGTMVDETGSAWAGCGS